MIINNLSGVINVKKVLAIDDSTVWRNFLQNLLEIKGYNVETAKDGLDGINKFFTFLPDVVIVDYVMPSLMVYISHASLGVLVFRKMLE